MTLKERIGESIKEAMKAKDEAGLRALRALKTALQVAETSEGQVTDLTEAQELQVVQKQAKQRRDSIEQFEANGRADLALKEKEELAIIEKYLPKALSSDELEDTVKSIIQAVGAASPADMGKVMKAANAQLAGQVDGKTLSETIKRLLAG